jgi:hypothetical protein
MFIVENNVNLLEEDYKIIEHTLSRDFPWFYQGTVPGDEIIQEHNYWAHNFWQHVLVRRDAEHIEFETNPAGGIVNSQYCGHYIKIFEKFCKDNSVDCSVVYRAAINHTIYYEGTQITSGIHIDHQFPHKVFIMYLTEFDDGETVLYNNNDSEIAVSKPKKFSAIIFDGLTKHSQKFCKKGQRRVIFLVTFN